MTRKRTVAAGLFAMPQAIAEAALECLTPDQRAKLTAGQAGEILQVAVNCSQAIGRIVERAPPPPFPDKATTGGTDG